MNVGWARNRCLDETGWDFQRATFVFTELNKQGTIPAEAEVFIYILGDDVWFLWKHFSLTRVNISVPV